MAYIVNPILRKAIYVNSAMQAAARKSRALASWAKMVAWISNSYYAVVRLSYAPPNTYAKGHIAEFVKHLKGQKGYTGLPGLLALAWIAEMQARGEVHYHVGMIIQQGCSLPYFDEVGWWYWGSTAVRTRKNPFYLLGYSKKAGGKKAYQLEGFPKGTRTYSVWIHPDVRKDILARVPYDYLDVRKWPFYVKQVAERYYRLTGRWPDISPDAFGRWLMRLPSGKFRLIKNPWYFDISTTHIWEEAGDR